MSAIYTPEYKQFLLDAKEYFDYVENNEAELVEKFFRDAPPDEEFLKFIKKIESLTIAQRRDFEKYHAKY